MCLNAQCFRNETHKKLNLTGTNSVEAVNVVLSQNIISIWESKIFSSLYAIMKLRKYAIAIKY